MSKRPPCTLNSAPLWSHQGRVSLLLVGQDPPSLPLPLQQDWCEIVQKLAVPEHRASGGDTAFLSRLQRMGAGEPEVHKDSPAQKGSQAWVALSPLGGSEALFQPQALG